MNPTSLILFVVTAAVCVSCSRGGDDVSYSPPEFPEQRELTVTVLNDDVMCSNAFGITLFDSVAVVKASGTDRTAFQVLALADGKHLGSFGIVGRGENELTDYRLYAPNPLASTVMAVDQSGKVAEFDPRRAAAGEKYAASGGRIHARATGNRMHCDGGRLLFMQGMPRLCLTDMSGRDTLARYDDYPSVTDAIDGDGMMRHGYFSLFGRYACRPDGEMVCCATENGMLLEILAVRAARSSLGACGASIVPN